MRKIYKYPLSIGAVQMLEVPTDHKILTAQLQQHTLTLWIEVDPDTPNTTIIIDIYGTGETVAPNGREYIATVQQDQYVWHIYKIA